MLHWHNRSLIVYVAAFTQHFFSPPRRCLFSLFHRAISTINLLEFMLLFDSRFFRLFFLTIKTIFFVSLRLDLIKYQQAQRHRSQLVLHTHFNIHQTNHYDAHFMASSLWKNMCYKCNKFRINDFLLCLFFCFARDDAIGRNMSAPKSVSSKGIWHLRGGPMLLMCEFAVSPKKKN